MLKSTSASPCETCPANARLEQMGLKMEKFQRVVALAGNPNTGKSTVFNALTGLNQHTGNWPGKTVSRAEVVMNLMVFVTNWLTCRALIPYSLPRRTRKSPVILSFLGSRTAPLWSLTQLPWNAT